MGVPIATKLSASQLSLAQLEIQKYDLSLEKPYLNLFKFLASNPEFRVSLRGNNPAPFGSPAYIEKSAQMFALGRIITPPVNSGKSTDTLLGILFQQMNQCSEDEAQEAIKMHGDFMVLENKVGKILEHYLATKLEPVGWIWCSGDYVEKIDFVKVGSSNFSVLQVKNKDVTENSSSSKGRGDVPKWARLKGKKAVPDWDNFPDEKAKALISEKDFLKHGISIGKSWIQ
jgi:hypothetical protein